MSTILIVDDDPDLVTVCRSILQTEGYQVLEAENGSQALKMLRREKPDLVLLDIMMTTILDGLSVSEEMLADPALKDVPIIMISSITDTQFASMFPTDEYVHMDAWISKPIHPEDLLKKIKQCLRHTDTADEQ